MKKLMVTTLMLALMSGFAMGQDFIGIFADDAGTTCDQDFDGFMVETMIYIMAYIPSFPGGITAAEFSMANVPENLGFPYGDADVYWNTDLVIGDWAYDVSLAFTNPLMGPFALLGWIELVNYEQDVVWIGDDHVIEVLPGQDCQCLVIVDHLYETYEVAGGHFTFNCTGECYCIDDPTATEDTSWSAVKSLF
jgi:hypothetical protein